MQLESPQPLTKSRAAEKVWMQFRCSYKDKSQNSKSGPDPDTPLWKSDHHNFNVISHL